MAICRSRRFDFERTQAASSVGRAKKWDGMKVIVTGGAGYIGSVAVERLLERGDAVAVLDNCWRGHHRSVPDGVELLDVDLRDAEAVASAIAGANPEAVLHFAAATI